MDGRTDKRCFSELCGMVVDDQLTLTLLLMRAAIQAEGWRAKANENLPTSSTCILYLYPRAQSMYSLPFPLT